MQEKVGRRQEGWSLLIEYSSSEERKFQRPTIQFWRSCIIISSSSSSSLSFLAAWFFLPSPSSFLPLVESFGDNWAAFIKITTVGLTRPLIIAAGIVNKVGAKRIVTRGDTRVQEQRCLIIDDTIDSRRLQPRSYVRPHIRAHVIHVVHEIISAGRWSDGQAIENCARGFLFAVRFRDREIFFFFRRFPRTLANTTLIIWGSANQPRWLQLRASFAAVRCSRIRYPHLINFLRDLTLSCSNFFNFVPFADNGCLRNNFRLVFDSTFK